MVNTAIAPRRVWIDLDNTPHVPFFAPIIRELEKRHCRVVLTARDAYQVCDLADLNGLSYVPIGRHNGRYRLMKALGTVRRSVQLLPFARRERPDLAVSHGSRSQLLTSAMLGIPSVLILDYEFVARIPIVQPTWLMAPEMIPLDALRREVADVMRYPGIKEDVYTPEFTPRPGFRESLGLQENDIVVTLRPPATDAHYHNPASEALMQTVVDLLVANPEVRVVVAPRNDRQAHVVRSQWPEHIRNGTLRVPEGAVDGLSLIWHSDAVISGGGTMNREAAALGVPVYSIFRGHIGSVDRQLAREGRLVLLETDADVRCKLKVRRREKRPAVRVVRPALDAVVANIMSALHERVPGISTLDRQSVEGARAR